MPHQAIYRRPEHKAVRLFTVTVSSPEGTEQYQLPASTDTEARREAMKLYAAEHDAPASAWARVH